MPFSRRLFLGGSLALTAARSQAAGEGGAATLYANGKDDDAAGLQALFDGRPVLLAGDGQVVQAGGGEITLNGSYIVSRPVRVGRGRPEVILDQASFARPGTDARSAAARSGDRVTPAAFGGAGDGLRDDSRALTAALASIAGSGKAVYLESGQRYASGDLRIPEGTVLVFEPGASLVPLRRGAKLLIDGEIVNPGGGRILEDGWSYARTDILNGFGDVPIEWFGGRPSFNEKHDNVAALQQALIFCKQMRARSIVFGAGCYYFSSEVVIDGAIGIRGAGIRSTVLFGRKGKTGAPVIALKATLEQNIVDIRFEHFSVYSEVPHNRSGIVSEWFASVTIDNVCFVNCATALDLKYMSYCRTISNCTFIDNQRHLVLGEQSNNTLVWRCQFMHGGSGIHLTGSSNAITVSGQTNFEYTPNAISWEGNGNRISLLTVNDCRFEKCPGTIGRKSGNAAIEGFSFHRNFVENSNGTSDLFLRLPDCNTANISNNYFNRANRALLEAPVSTVQISVHDNVLIDIPSINSASPSGGFRASEGFVRSRAFNCGGVKGSDA